MAISFIRLTINPAVFSAYPRSGTAILNWHLYTYGIAAAAQFMGAWWLPASYPERARPGHSPPAAQRSSKHTLPSRLSLSTSVQPASLAWRADW